VVSSAGDSNKKIAKRKMTKQEIENSSGKNNEMVEFFRTHKLDIVFIVFKYRDNCIIIQSIG